MMSEYMPGNPGEQNQEQSSYGYHSCNNNYNNYGYNGGYQPQPPRKKKKTGRIVALCLACVLLAGAAGVGTGVFVSSLNHASVSQAPEASGGATNGGAQDNGGSGTVLDTQIVGNGGSTPVKSEYTGDTLSAEEIYAMGVKACVGIRTDVTQNIFGQVTSSAISGSGFVISSDGYILTNYHVIETADEQGLEITVTFYDGQSYTAKIVGKDAENDVALIKMDAQNLPTLVINTTGDLLVGQQVYVIGNPLGELTYSMTGGIVSALDREISVESNVSINMFQTDAAINSGNSGGPVLNDKGEVIGIASAKYASTGVEGLGFAIPIEDAMNIVDDLVQYGYVRGKPYFGISVRTMTDSVAQYYNWAAGAYVVKVDENSCAATAGLKVGDIITKLDDTEVTSSSDLIKAKHEYTAGDTAHLTVYRNGEYIQLVITFDEEGARNMLTGESQNG